jgi:hypothetical protein
MTEGTRQYAYAKTASCCQDNDMGVYQTLGGLFTRIMADPPEPVCPYGETDAFGLQHMWQPLSEPR